MGLVNCLLSQGQFEEPVRPFALSMNEDCVELCRYFPPLQNYWIRGCLHSLHPPKKTNSDLRELQKWDLERRKEPRTSRDKGNSFSECSSSVALTLIVRCHSTRLHTAWRRGSEVRTSVFGWRTFPDLRLIYGYV